MIKRIKALIKSEFDAAKPYGDVYGSYKGLYVYIILGREETYRENPKDDPKTEYRLFRSCDIDYSETEEQSEQGIYQYSEKRVDIILYW
ncbi:MAG: hypothetical protein AB4372_32090 [Xenococcus sp. (in: cyanobacteria)]